MKNNGCFAAVTFTMTIAGACVGYGLRADPAFAVGVVAIIAVIGGFAAALCGHRD